MKRWKIWGSIFIALMMVLGIVFATPVFRPELDSSVTAAESPDFYLWAGQTILVGTGNVTSDSDSLDFTIATDCAISYIHIKIIDGTPVEGDQHAPGSFPHHINYTSSPQTGVFDFSIPFTPGDWTSPISILLHADVVCGFYEGNTAWAGDLGRNNQIPGEPWAYYFTHSY